MAPANQPPSRPSAHVLVVDDDPASARAVATCLRELGHRTTEAHTWIDAVRSFSSDIDLVLMDAVMPTVDGFKLTLMLRQRAHSYVPILFLTALTDSSAKRRGVDSGADDFLLKPVDPLELSVRLKAMLRIRQLTRELEHKQAALESLARIDPLTGVGNRRYLHEQLETEIARSDRYGSPLGLIMLDADHFKAVNDNFGHAVGDDLLVLLGGVLQECTRPTDSCYRVGGEEFVVVAPETSSAGVSALANRIRETFNERSATATPAGPQTLSAGVVCVSGHDDAGGPDALLSAADSALYQAKVDGRNRICVARRSNRSSAA